MPMSREKQKEWVQKNRLHVYQTQKAWRDKNIERLKAKRLERYWKNRERAIAQSAEWKKLHRGSASERGRARQYRISVAELRALLESNPICRICDKNLTNSEKQIDHNHTTGRIRGILCFNCNNGLGAFKDDLGKVHRAWKYLAVDEVLNTHCTSSDLIPILPKGNSDTFQ